MVCAVVNLRATDILLVYIEPGLVNFKHGRIKVRLVQQTMDSVMNDTEDWLITVVSRGKPQFIFNFFQIKHTLISRRLR